MIGLLVSLVLLSSQPPVPEEWSQFEKAYQLVLNNQGRGWKTLESWQAENGIRGDLSRWIMFQHARDHDEPGLAMKRAEQMIAREAIPAPMADILLDFILSMDHDLGDYDHAVSSYDRYISRTTASFQRKYRVKVTYYLYKQENSRYRKLFRTIVRNGSNRERLELFALFKSNMKHFPDEDLVRIYRAAVTLQRWEEYRQIKKELEKRKLSASHRYRREYLTGRALFRQDRFEEAIRHYKKVYSGSKESIRYEARYQAARCHLYLGHVTTSKQLLTSVRGRLKDYAQYTLARIALDQKDRAGYDRSLKAIRNSGIRRRLKILQAVSLVRDGNLSEAKSLLKTLRSSPEVDYWMWKTDPLPTEPVSTGLSYFSFILWDGKPFPETELTTYCPDEPFTEPHTMLEYIYDRGFFELVAPYAQEIFPGKQKDAACFRAALYLQGGHPDSCIRFLWKEHQDYSRVDPWLWPEDLKQLRYPLLYMSEIKEASEKWHVPASLLLSIIHQESQFNALAHSPAGARGLMQLMPQTSQKVDPEALNLFDPATNIDVGAHYLSGLYARYGRWDHTIAAYNAGETAVDLWIKQLGPAGMDYFFSYVPYKETRTYLDRVFSGWLMYQTMQE